MYNVPCSGAVLKRQSTMPDKQCAEVHSHKTAGDYCGRLPSVNEVCASQVLAADGRTLGDNIRLSVTQVLRRAKESAVKRIEMGSTWGQPSKT